MNRSVYKADNLDKVVAYKSKRGAVGLKPTPSLIRVFGLSEKDPDLMDWIWLTPVQERELYKYLDHSVLNDLEQGWRLCVMVPRVFTASVFNH